MQPTCNRITANGVALHADERVDTYDALKGVTRFAAYQYFEEGTKGTIALGKRADLMINAQSPTMITADIAFRINAYGDYGVANALGVISLLLTSSVAWLYMRQAVKERM